MDEHYTTAYFVYFNNYSLVIFKEFETLAEAQAFAKTHYGTCDNGLVLVKPFVTTFEIDNNNIVIHEINSGFIYRVLTQSIPLNFGTKVGDKVINPTVIEDTENKNFVSVQDTRNDAFILCGKCARSYPISDGIFHCDCGNTITL